MPGRERRGQRRGRRGWAGGSAAVPAPGGVATQGTLELSEGQRAHGDGARAHRLEARPLVEGHQGVLAHEHGPAHGRLARQVVQVAPQQDGAVAVVPEGAVHGQRVQVGRVAPGPVLRQRLLGPG